MLWAQAVESFGGTHAKAQRPAFMRAPRAGTRPSTIPTSTFCAGQPRPCPQFWAARTRSPLRPSTSATRRRTRPAAGSPAIRRSFLKQEALLSRVADPGAGSYCLEAITDFIAREGWKSMQRIEAAGGYRKAAGGWADRAGAGTIAGRQRKGRGVAPPHLYRDQPIRQSSLRRHWTASSLARFRENGAARRAMSSFVCARNAMRPRPARPPRVLLAEIGDVKMRVGALQLRRQLLCLRGLRYCHAAISQRR